VRCPPNIRENKPTSIDLTDARLSSAWRLWKVMPARRIWSDLYRSQLRSLGASIIKKIYRKQRETKKPKSQRWASLTAAASEQRASECEKSPFMNLWKEMDSLSCCLLLLMLLLRNIKGNYFVQFHNSEQANKIEFHDSN